MLTDPVEIEIISGAKQPGVADPRRSREPFARIFEDFLEGVAFEGARCIDLGAGQHDFGELARKRGAEVVATDNDPAVLELGRHKGFDSREVQLRKLVAAGLDGPYDGVFCKFSINAFWHLQPGAGRAAVDEIAGLGRPDGWSWIAPWNGVPKKAELSPDATQAVLHDQAAAFRAHGYEAFDLSDELARRFGVSGAVANHALFVRNLPVPPEVAACPSL